MMKSIMNIKTLFSVLDILPIGDSVLIRADHGVGKSQIVRQFTAKLIKKTGINYTFIDRRLSQMSEGDMIGLPSIKTLACGRTVTSFSPPDWYMKACLEPCVLFLDEFNRATQEIQNAAFQIVLDRELNGHPLHPETRVYAAVNTGAAYNVNEIDPALLDRFFVIDLVPSVEEWIEFALTKKKNGETFVDEAIVEFIRINEKFLDSNVENVDPGSVDTSRRSWVKFSDAARNAGIVEDPENPNFYSMALGYIGTEAAISLTSFIKNFDRQISAKDVFENYTTDKIQNKLRGVDRQNIVSQEVWNTLVERVGEKFKGLTEISPSQGANLKQFFWDLPKELRVVAWSKTSNQSENNTDLIKALHPYVVEAILDSFGTKLDGSPVDVAAEPSNDVVKEEVELKKVRKK